MSTVNAAQNHADNMLQNSYSSYWDTNGYKPYMRYTLAGGLGAVTENYASAIIDLGTINPYDTIKNLETLMMLSSQKTNILYPSHNQVSIGIAYNNTSLYFVEDFENVHVTWTTLSVTNGNVTMNGILDSTNLTVQGVAIYYDSPSPLTPQQLDSPTYYNTPYDLGTLIAAAIPSNSTKPGVIIPAQLWNQTGQNFQINFNLQDTFLTHGKGVYTLCLMSSLNETDTMHNSLCTYSIWYSG